jgi:hypothetical protein
LTGAVFVLNINIERQSKIFTKKKKKKLNFLFSLAEVGQRSKNGRLSA